MKLKYLSSFLILFFLLLSQNALPQFNLYSDYQLIFDDNIYNNFLNTEDLLNNFQLGSAYNIESEFNNLQFYYEGTLGDYRTNKNKSFNAHKIGIVNTHLFTDDVNPLNIGINYSFRNNKDEYSLYNFRQLSGYANYRYSIKETNFLIIGYIFYKNDYPNFTVFSNYEHKSFLKWISNFETLTSIMISAEFNYKKYSEQYNFPGYANDGSYIKLFFNLGQSLGENTGANLFASVRKNLSEKSRYVINDSLIFYEEEIFNDLYAYNSFEAGFGLTQLIGDELKLSTELKYSPRYFTSLYSADEYGREGNDLRKDFQLNFGVGIEYQLSEILDGLNISAAFNFINNKSNDYYYDYSNKMFSFSVGYGF